MTTYCDGADLAARYDVRIVGDLCTDDGAALSLADIVVHPNVLVAIADAAGNVEVAMRQGKRYMPDKLASLTGNSLSHLKRVICAVAMALLIERRPERVNLELAATLREQGEKYLIALQSGHNVFGLDDDSDVNATLMTSSDGPTAIEIENRNLLGERMGRHLPSDTSRLPLDRW